MVKPAFKMKVLMILILIFRIGVKNEEEVERYVRGFLRSEL